MRRTADLSWRVEKASRLSSLHGAALASVAFLRIQHTARIHWQLSTQSGGPQLWPQLSPPSWGRLPSSWASREVRAEVHRSLPASRSLQLCSAHLLAAPCRRRLRRRRLPTADSPPPPPPFSRHRHGEINCGPVAAGAGCAGAGLGPGKEPLGARAGASRVAGMHRPRLAPPPLTPPLIPAAHPASSGGPPAVQQRRRGGGARRRSVPRRRRRRRCVPRLLVLACAGREHGTLAQQLPSHSPACVLHTCTHAYPPHAAAISRPELSKHVMGDAAALARLEVRWAACAHHC